MQDPTLVLFADEGLDLSLDVRQRDNLKSLIKLTLLFQEQLLLSDAQLIGNRNFRSLLREPDFLRMFDKSNISIAIRDTVDYPVLEGRHIKDIDINSDILKIQESFIAWNKCHWKDSITDVHNEYKSTRELQQICEFAEQKKYDIKQTGIQYSNEAIAIFTTERAKRALGEELSDCIRELALEYRATQATPYNPLGGLGSKFFKTDIWIPLQKRGFIPDADAQKLIVNFALAPYLTGILNQIKSKPYYTSIHRSRLQLLRDHSIDKAELHEIFHYSSRLLSFNRGLQVLSSEDIWNLRSDRLFKDYLEAVQSRKIDSIKQALIGYLNKIDEVILKKCPSLKEPRASKRDSFGIMYYNYGSQVGFGIGLLNEFAKFLKLPHLEIPTAITLVGSIVNFFHGATLNQRYADSQRVADGLKQAQIVDNWEKENLMDGNFRRISLTCPFDAEVFIETD